MCEDTRMCPGCRCDNCQSGENDDACLVRRDYYWEGIQERWKAAGRVIRSRCHDDFEHALTRLVRWFYTFKALVCLLQDWEFVERLRATGFPEEYATDGICAAQLSYSRLYAGWEASWVYVGTGVCTGWWYSIERDGEWEM